MASEQYPAGPICRRWRLVITGDYADYANASLPLSVVVFIVVFIADMLLFALMINIILRNYQKIRISEANILQVELSNHNRILKLESESQNLRLFYETSNAERIAMETEVHLSKVGR